MSLHAVHNDLQLGSIPRRLRADYHHFRNTFSKIWKQIQSRGVYDYDNHVFANLMSVFDAEGSAATAESIKKATRRCHTSCPECLEEFGINALGALNGPIYANKRLLDSLVSTSMDSLGGVFRRIFPDVESLARGLEGFASFNTETSPIEVNTNSGPRILRPMMQPVDLWPELDTRNPIDLTTGKINDYLRLKMFDSGWD